MNEFRESISFSSFSPSSSCAALQVFSTHSSFFPHFLNPFLSPIFKLTSHAPAQASQEDVVFASVHHAAATSSTSAHQMLPPLTSLQNVSPSSAVRSTHVVRRRQGKSRSTPFEWESFRKPPQEGSTVPSLSDSTAPNPALSPIQQRFFSWVNASVTCGLRTCTWSRASSVNLVAAAPTTPEPSFVRDRHHCCSARQGEQ